MRGFPLKAFPLGGRWHGEAVTDEGAISPKCLPPGGQVPPKGADEGAMIERFRSSQGDISPPAGGEFLSQRWERNQRIAGGRGRRALRAHRTATLPPLSLRDISL